MPWHIGIDEAGYGPNLGPLLQTAIGVRFREQPCDLWKVLRRVVRKHGGNGSGDARLVIDDSKKVYGPNHSLRNLELGVLATVCPPETSWPVPLGHFLMFVAPDSLAELIDEPWFDEWDEVPAVAKADEIKAACETFHAVREKAALSNLRTNCRLTPPGLFNRLLEQHCNKAEVLSHGLCHLIRQARNPDDGSDAIVFAIDRQGGRMYHAALLSSACPDGWIETIAENEAECIYRMAAARPLTWSFEVGAESRHFTVALASMVSKYLREVLMKQFNRFWRNHIPELKPTAGYPLDAHRYFAEIQGAMRTLQISHSLIWRRK